MLAQSDSLVPQQNYSFQNWLENIDLNKFHLPRTKSV